MTLDAQQPDKPGLDGASRDHEGEKGEQKSPGVHRACGAEGHGLKQPQGIGLVKFVGVRRGFVGAGRRAPGPAVLATEAQGEHAAGGRQFDPDGIEQPVLRREGHPDPARKPAGQSGGNGENEGRPAPAEAGIEGDQSAKQDSSQNGERHGGIPADRDWRPIKFEGKALTFG
ncbi:hypothetical protein [Rhodoblastus sp.]|uniref:hypothetical protein n=1 Tax=Rhodoblastus sp. TaxID=1962975 RepID=UPI0035B4D492